jgi:Cft2 family RNA processing exonuclease
MSTEARMAYKEVPMNILFIGGASEVGASCLALQLAGRWIIVDAGVQFDRQADALPDLALLQDKPVQAIFVTHAHTDHIGALPLVHQAFPDAPIYASRATGLLIEVMLADSLKIMERRAAEEMELPLYSAELVGNMLNQIRPLPVGEFVTVPELPDVSIFASPAGHIAGAVSFGFAAPDGSLIVSGDISVTDQQTVPGAVPPPLPSPDLLILESTYGARLHANRQAEEQRFLQAVADGIARGGHVLIPCFGLGRGQEALLLLVEAQRQGHIPEFPLYVDGMVRRICSTYHLLPEALTPRLQRQMRQGYYPFAGKLITFVRDDPERERILSGPPACIISSSGRLTGGPSMWYASRLISNPTSSILLTGYQDEESPGKRLLDIADCQNDTLELNGQQLQVRCQVSRYYLSAHADSGELAAYASSLQARRIALVHGSNEARTALKARLSEADVILPANGQMLTVTHNTQPLQPAEAHPIDMAPQGIGRGTPFEAAHLEQLWRVVSQTPGLRIVTVRELARIWDGEATEETTSRILHVLSQDSHHRYFAPLYILEEAFWVRGTGNDPFSESIREQVIGQILLIQVAPGQAQPGLCHGLVPSASVRVEFAPGISRRRRYAYSAILDVLGPLPEHIQGDQVPSYLAHLSHQARAIRQGLSAKELAFQCQDSRTYHLGKLCELVGLSPTDPAARLAVAGLVRQNPHIFYAHQSFLKGEGPTHYTIAPNWRQATERREIPTRDIVFQIIESHIGHPSDLYRKSFNPTTGKVTLSFHFPEIARKQYQQVLQIAQQEAGVPIVISPQPHQQAMEQAAQQVLPAGLTLIGNPSIYYNQQRVHLNTSGQTTRIALAEACARFQEMTGWKLSIAGASLTSDRTSAPGAIAPPPDCKVLPPEEARYCAEQTFMQLPDFKKVVVDKTTRTLTLHFQFPDIAGAQQKHRLQALTEQTGWYVAISPETLNEDLLEQARDLLPEELQISGSLEIIAPRKLVRLFYRGQSTHQRLRETMHAFRAQTGWSLSLIHIPDSTRPKEKAAPPMPVEPGIMEMTAALQYAQQKLGDLQGYVRVGVENETCTLVPRFCFPDTAEQRYSAEFASVAAATGWHVRLHPFPHVPAIKDLVGRLLPRGLICTSLLSILQDKQEVRVVCAGEAAREEIEQVQQQFQEATGWTLVLQPSLLAENEHEDTPHTSRIQAMGHVFTVLTDAPDLYQISADERSHTIWLAFYFPERARERYKAQLQQLARETGWQVKIDEDVQPRALLETAQRLLPDGIFIVSKAIQRDQQLLRVSCTGTMKHEELQKIQKEFLAQTGWELHITCTGKPALHITAQGQMSEVEAQGFLLDELGKRGIPVQQISIDATQRSLRIHLRHARKLLDAALLAELEKHTGWHVHVAEITSTYSDTLSQNSLSSQAPGY